MDAKGVTNLRGQCNGRAANATQGVFDGHATAGSPRVVAHPGFPQIRTCPIKAYGSSGQGFATSPEDAASRCCFVDTVPRFDALAMLPANESLTRCLLPYAGSPWGGFPGIHGTMRRCDFRRPSRRASLPSLGGTTRAPWLRSPRSKTRNLGAWGWYSGVPDRTARGAWRTSQVPGEPR